MSVAHPESPLEICYRLLIRMCAVVWNDLEVQVATFLVRHFASHKSTEHFLDGSFHSGIRAGIIHKSSPSLPIYRPIRRIGQTMYSCGEQYHRAISI